MSLREWDTTGFYDKNKQIYVIIDWWYSHKTLEWCVGNFVLQGEWATWSLYDRNIYMYSLINETASKYFLEVGLEDKEHNKTKHESSDISRLNAAYEFNT